MKKMLILLLFALGSIPLMAEETLEEKILSILEECNNALLPARENDAEAFVWFTGIPHPRFNVVMHLCCTDVEAKIDEILSSASEHAPFSFWVHPLNKAEHLAQSLIERNFKFFIRFPGMLWHVRPINKPQLQVYPVETKADLEVFHQIIATNLHYGDDVKNGYATLLGKAKVENYLVYIDDRPVGSGTLWWKEDKGVLMNVMILPEFQKKGAGRAISQYMMYRAYSLGLKELALRSSPAAEHLYTSLGFQKGFDIDVYVRSY